MSATLIFRHEPNEKEREREKGNIYVKACVGERLAINLHFDYNY